MKQKILLAEESITIQKVVAIACSEADKPFDIVNVDNGEEALKMVRQVHPDIVVANAGLPKGDGYFLCEQIRQDSGLNTTPVLLLLSPSETYDSRRGELCGVDDHIIKPFESKMLVEKINALLAKRGARKPKVDALWVADTPQRQENIVNNLEELHALLEGQLPAAVPEAAPTPTPEVSPNAAPQEPNDLATDQSTVADGSETWQDIFDEAPEADREPPATVERAAEAAEAAEADDTVDLSALDTMTRSLVESVYQHPDFSNLIGRIARQTLDGLVTSVVAETLHRAIEERVASLKTLEKQLTKREDS